MKLIEVPDYGTIEFPDEMSDDEIGEVIRTQIDTGAGRVASAGQSFMRAGGVGVGQAMSGLARLGQILGSGGMMVGPGNAGGFSNPGLIERRAKEAAQSPAEREEALAEDPIYKAGQEVAAGAREAYTPNPKFAGEFFSDVLPSSGGQMVPTLAAGLVNPGLAVSQYGLSSAQQGAEEALAADRPDLVNLAALGYGAAGAVSEAALGVPANVIKRFYRPAREGATTLGRTALKAGVHEAGQEGTEQVLQNVTAQSFDPERPLLEGVPESMAAGFLLGGSVGAGAHAVGRSAPPADPESTALIPAPDDTLNELPPGLEIESPIPEGAATLEAQLAATADASSGKAVTLIVPDSPEAMIPEGLDWVDVPQGVAVYNPAKVSLAEVTEAGSGPNFDGRLLGMSQAQKPATPDVVAVTTRAPDGTPEVVGEMVARNPQAIAAAAAAHQAAAPGGLTEVRSVEGALAERAAAATPVQTPGPTATDASVPQPQPTPAEGVGSLGAQALARLEAIDQALSRNTYSDPLLLTPLAKLAVKIAKVLVKGGMALDVAIRDAVKQARAQMPDATDRDDVLSQAMARGLDVRQFTGQLDAAEDIPDPVKQATTNRLYERKPNEATAAFAARIVQSTGPAAVEVFRDQANGLGGAERTMLGQLIVKRLSAEGQHEAAARFLDDDLLPYSTEAGQALQAFAAFSMLSPTGALIYAKRQFNRAGKGIRERVKPVVDVVADVIGQVNRTSIEDTVNSADVQKAAGEAIDQTLEAQANQAGTEIQAAATEETIEDLRKRGAITQVQADGLRRILAGKGTWAEVFGAEAGRAQREYKEGRNRTNRTIKERAKKQRKAKPDSTAERILRRFAVSQSDTLSWAKRKGVADAVARAVREQLATGALTQEEFRAKLEGLGVPAAVAAPLSSVVMRERVIRDRIKLERARQREEARPTQTAEGIVSRFAKHQTDTPTWSNTPAKVNAVRQLVARQLSERVFTPEEFTAELRKLGVEEAAAGTLTNVVFRELAAQELASETPDSPLDAAIRKELQRLRTTLGKLVRRHYTEVNEAGHTIEQRLVTEAGLPPEAAKRLGDRIAARFRVLVQNRKEREIAKIERASPRVPHRVKQSWARLIELSNLGALGRPAAWQAVAEKLKLPQWTSEHAKRVEQLADEIQRTPEGFQRDRKVVALLNYLARSIGVPISDLGMAFWYANMLSGPTTHAINLLANTQNLVSNLLIQARSPQDFIAQAVAAGRGLKRGGRDALAVLRTGNATRTGDLKMQAARPLELLQLPGRYDYLLTPWRMVGRSLAAGDALFFRGAEEMRRTLLARQLARDEGLSGPTLARRVAEVTGTTTEQRAEAMRQAQLEGLTGSDFKRRVDELMDATAPESVRENARSFALRATYNQKPYGFLGAVADGINWIGQRPWGLPVRLVVPFTNIIANVANEGLNYVPPVGLGRAIYGHWKGELEGQPITDRNALGDQYAKAALGTVLMGVIWAAAEAHMDDDDPWFAISAGGPSGKGQRDQLRASGWIPHSIKLGDRWYSYASSPAAIGLAAMGNWFDARRYRKLDDRGAWDRLAFVLKNFGKVITEQSFLEGLAGVASSLKRDDVKGGDDLARTLGRTASSFVIPNALRQLDRWFDPTVYDAKTVEAALTASVPFVRRAERPALNPWGEPVRAEISKRFTSEWKPTALEATLARRNLWISAPRREEMEIGGKPVTDAEFYQFIQERGRALKRMVDRPAVIKSLADSTDETARALWGRYTDAASKIAKGAVMTGR